ncbi:MAG: hypothetical protein AVDCRST_MAG30-1561, partial [uncultured Solirubrobacteraceae bacterium]
CTGMSSRSIACSSSPSSSQCESSAGKVEMTTASAANTLSASSMAVSGSASPTVPVTSNPSAASPSSARSSRARAAFIAPSESDTRWRRRELSAGATTAISAGGAPAFSCTKAWSPGQGQVRLARTRIRCIPPMEHRRRRRTRKRAPPSETR